MEKQIIVISISVLITVYCLIRGIVSEKTNQNKDVTFYEGAFAISLLQTTINVMLCFINI